MIDMTIVPLPTLTRLKVDFEQEYKEAMQKQGKPPITLWFANGEYQDPYIQQQWTKYVDLAFEQAKPLSGDAALAAEAHAAEPRPSKWDHLPAQVSAELATEGRAAVGTDDDLVSNGRTRLPTDHPLVGEAMDLMDDAHEESRQAVELDIDVGATPPHIQQELAIAMGMADAAQQAKAARPMTAIAPAPEDSLTDRQIAELQRQRAERRTQRFLDTQTGDADTDLSMLHSSIDDILTMEIDLLRNVTEKHRREPALLDAIPVPGVMDYGNAGTAISYAMHHLDESLPNGQRKRSEYAYKLLAIGTEKLGIWMRTKGYDV